MSHLQTQLDEHKGRIDILIGTVEGLLTIVSQLEKRLAEAEAKLACLSDAVAWQRLQQETF